jgi:hypothetical protein
VYGIFLVNAHAIKVLYKKAVTKHHKRCYKKVNEQNRCWNECRQLKKTEANIYQHHKEKRKEYGSYASESFLETRKPDNAMVSAKNVK